MLSQLAVQAPDVRQAHARIEDAIVKTPVLRSEAFDRLAGVQAYFKCENLQRGGSFKIRGAMNFLRSIPEEDLPRGVVAYSSGNHAQATAIAAQAAGVPATIIMPLDAPKSKVEGTRARGAHIIQYDRYTEDREVIAKQVQAESGATLVPPFDHEWTIAGAGTTGLELIKEVPQMDTFVCCLGGGGLLSGSALAIKDVNASVRIYGVEPEAGNDYFLSLQKGEPVKIPTPKTIADGLQTPRPGNLTFPIIQALADAVLLVSDDELRATCHLLLTQMKLLVEPSGAAAAAAVLFGKVPVQGTHVGITISGGNVDFDQLATWVS